MVVFSPPDIWRLKGRISHGVASGNGRQIHITGQIAFDSDRNVVGRGDVGRQMQICVDHIERILDGFGGRLQDVVSLTVFYTEADHIDRIRTVWDETFDPADTAPACIMIQVAGLVHPDLLIELIPTAIIPHERFSAPAEAMA